tara:strand:- start:259 stop:468 length:210 start_codon:yes stop_codon:yes gene_type:complete
MKKNIGSKDRNIRLGLAVIIAILFYTNAATGTLALVFVLIIGVLIITSLFSFCPLYFPFRVSTRKKEIE